MNYRFILEPYGGTDSRFMCPNCQHRRNTFKRYIDTETQSYLADHVGMCDRADNCGYHFTPREYFATNPDKRPGANQNPFYTPEPTEVKDHSTLPWAYVSNTMRSYENNNFIKFLERLFDEETARYLAFKYKIGTSKHWPGATIFWQADINEKVRTGKIMLYDANTCKRVKEPFNHITWVHNLLVGSGTGSSSHPIEQQNTATAAATATLKIKQCFFGEHLLKAHSPGERSAEMVAIVESEKTAIIASIYHPNYTWLAAGSVEGLTLEKCRVLEGRDVILFPDVNSYAKWHDKARYLKNRLFTATFRTDGTLERTATPAERQRGIDIADKWVDEKLLEWEVERG